MPSLLVSLLKFVAPNILPKIINPSCWELALLASKTRKNRQQTSGLSQYFVRAPYHTISILVSIRLLYFKSFLPRCVVHMQFSLLLCVNTLDFIGRSFFAWHWQLLVMLKPY